MLREDTARAEIALLEANLVDPNWDNQRYKDWARGRISGIKLAMGWVTFDKA